jgi:hypothetical protein
MTPQKISIIIKQQVRNIHLSGYLEEGNKKNCTGGME